MKGVRKQITVMSSVKWRISVDSFYQTPYKVNERASLVFGSWGCPFFSDVEVVADLQVALLVIINKLYTKKNQNPY